MVDLFDGPGKGGVEERVVVARRSSLQNLNDIIRYDVTRSKGEKKSKLINSD